MAPDRRTARTDSWLIGNFPQGLSHIGLINAAWTIEQAGRDGRAATPEPTG